MAVRELVFVFVYGVSLCEGRRDGGLPPGSLTTDIFEMWIYVREDAWSRGVVRDVRQRSGKGLAPRQRSRESVTSVGRLAWVVQMCFVA